MEISTLEKRVTKESTEYASFIRVLDKHMGKFDVHSAKESSRQRESEMSSSQASSTKVQLSLA